MLAAAGIDYASAPFVPGLGYRLSDDLFYLPIPAAPTADPAAAPGATPAESPPVGQRPYGAQSVDGSEYMSGSVYVTVVLLESNGSVDAETENWTPGEIASVKSEITEGLTWWQTTYANQGYTSSLSFSTDFTNADSPFSTSYEPINRPSSEQDLWIDEFLAAHGGGAGNPGVAQFNDAQRMSHNTDWAYTIFVADSSADPDGEFADGLFAYAYANGPLAVMTYDNDGWGISSMGQVIAHESGHIFGALDEYAGSDLYTEHSGYYNIQNLNAADGNPTPAQRVNSLMGEPAMQDIAYANHTSSPTSLQMIGWRDTDVDGIIDVLDRPLTLTGATGWWDPALRRYTFSATSAVQALANLNPNSHSSPASAISLNEVDYLQYRVDGAAWVNVNSTPYAAFSQTFTNVQINLPNPFSTLELRTYSADSRATSAVFTANTGPVPPSQFSFSAANYSGAEGSGQATITVVRQNNTSGPATVDYATSNGTATAGQDYTTTAGTLNFADGQSSLTFQVPIINDTLAEGDETVGLALSNPTGPGAVLGAQSTATLTVVDNDVNFRFSSASYSASEGAGQALITIQRIGQVNSLAAVGFSAAAGTAMNNADYVPVTGQVVFSAGQSTQTVTIPLLQDSIIEGDETVQLTLTSVGGGEIASPGSATLTIVDDDAGFLFSADTFTASEGVGSAAIVVQRIGSLTGIVSVVFQTADESATAGLDYTAVTQTLDFVPGEQSKIVTVPLLDDMLREEDETVRLILTNPAGQSALLIPNRSTLVISNDDSAFQFSSAIYNVNETDGIAAITVERTGAVNRPATVDFSAVAGTATPGTNFTAATGTLAFAPGQATQVMVVPILNHPVPDATCTVQMTLSNAAGQSSLGTPLSAILNILDVDVTPPQISDVSLTYMGRRIAGVRLQFSEAINPGDYGTFFDHYGLYSVRGSRPQAVRLRAANYDAGTHAVTLLPQRALSENTTYQLNVRSDGGLVDRAGHVLDGNGDGVDGGDFRASFAVGSRLSYTDRDGDLVRLVLARGGRMELIRGADGEAQTLRLMDTRAGRSVLSGIVQTPVRSSGGGVTNVDELLGTHGVQVLLGTPSFITGRMA